MHANTKKTVIPYGRPKLTVVRNIERSKTVTEEVDDKEKREKKALMPDLGAGYIKTRKHDCL